MTEENSDERSKRLYALANQLNTVSSTIDIDNRRFALEKAQQFFQSAAGSPGGIANAAAILGVAKMYASFLNDGTMPDLTAEAVGAAKLSWNISAAMFGPDVVQAAKESLKGEK